MTNWEKLLTEKSHFLSFRYVSAFELPEHLFTWLKKACIDAKKEGDKANSKLLGHIKEEYNINNVSEEFENYITSCSIKGAVFEAWKSINVISENKPIYLDKLWVNYQKKHEFNPPHDHSGFVSFVIFINIPYDLEEEENMFSSLANTEKSVNHTSKFAFINPSYDGKIRVDPIDVDKSFEGNMMMFSADQMHEVYPFYTSDDYRITVSGNLKFRV